MHVEQAPIFFPSDSTGLAVFLRLFPHCAAFRKWSRILSSPCPGGIPPGTLGRPGQKGRKNLYPNGNIRSALYGKQPDVRKLPSGCRQKALCRAHVGGIRPLPPVRREKNALIQLNDRIRACFRNSLHGTPPPAGGETVRALNAYLFWLAKGAPVGLPLRGQGFRTIPVPKQGSPLFRGPHILRTPDTLEGMTLYQNRCASCHGLNGQGNPARGGSPVWGTQSYPMESGFHSVRVLAEFLKMNMPPGPSGRLTDQESWDIAAYVASQPRPR